MDQFQKAYEAIEEATKNDSRLESHKQTHAQIAIAWALIDIAESLREIKRTGITDKY
jgi:hypothetical protein